MTKISYSGIHKWLSYVYGNPTKCEKCGKDGLTKHKIHWAKIKGKEYEKKRENYWRICAKCHLVYDAPNRKTTLGQHWKIKDTSNMKGRIPWNKGLIGFMKGHKAYNTKSNSGSFIRGEHRSVKTEFKKGQIPWNKGKKLKHHIIK